MSSNKLLIIIPGFGGSIEHRELKKKLISKNLEILRNTYNGLIDVYIFCYDNQGTKLNIKDVNIKEICESGIIGQFIYKYIKQSLVEKYDNLIILLDDIELNNNTNVNKLIELQNKYNADILSPSLTRDSEYSHEFMLQDGNNKIRDVNFIELFFYFFNKNSFLKWLGLLDDKSAWLWGIDQSLYFNKFKLLLIDSIPMKHYLRGAATNPNLPSPHLEQFNTIIRCTPFKNLKNYGELLEIIGKRCQKHFFKINNYLEYN